MANLPPSDPSTLAAALLAQLQPYGISPMNDVPQGIVPLGGAPYRNVPNQLMGFSKSGQNKGFDESKYPHTQTVRVEFPATKSSPADSFVDQIKGMNPAHAMERAFRNWPGANIKPADPSEMPE